MTADDKRILQQAGVRWDDGRGPLEFTTRDYEMLVGNLRQDLMASEGELRAAREQFAALARSHERLAERVRHAEQRERLARRCAWIAGVAAALTAGVSLWR